MIGEPAIITDEVPTRPQYAGNSIVNLMASIEAGLGGGAPGADYPVLAALPPGRLAEARNVVLLVVDGLGYRYLMEHGGNGALCAHLQGWMTTVFPATTAAAITTFLTGLAPQQHAHTGWFTYFEELRAVLAGLPCRLRGSRDEIDAAALAGLFDAEPVFARLARQTFVVVPECIAYSTFNTRFTRGATVIGFNDLLEMFDYTAAVVGCRTRNYVYTYWPEYDRMAHAYGAGSREVRRHLREFDKAFAGFLRAARGSDTLVIVTSDHGFVDTSPQRYLWLDEDPDLAAALAQPLCGEPRAAYCYVHEGQREKFAELAQARYGDRLRVVPSAELIGANYFGLGEPNPRLARRVGDVTLLPMADHVVKDRVEGERSYVQLGVHGGVSEAELLVPLIVAEV